jgi:hypothetical protein
MVSSAKLALYVLFQDIRSSRLGSNLKAFILRCLLLWPRILTSLRKVWSWYFQTSSSDEKDTKGDSDTGRPAPLGALRKQEEYVVVCASQDFGRVPVGEPSGHSMSGSSDAEPSVPMEDIIRRNPSVHTLSSLAPSRQGSPRLSPPPSPRGSPVSWTHPRAAGNQFTGVTSRSHSRPPSPSPFPFPFLRHSSRPNTPTGSIIDFPTRLGMIQDSENPPSGIPIEIRGPSRPGTPEDTRSVDSFSPPQGPQFPSATVHGRTQSLSTHHGLPSTELMNPAADSNGHSPSGYGSIRPENPMTSGSQSTQAFPRPPIPFPEPSIYRISTQASTMRQMHSDQVSRYVKNGDV